MGPLAGAWPAIFLSSGLREPASWVFQSQTKTVLLLFFFQINIPSRKDSVRWGINTVFGLISSFKKCLLSTLYLEWFSHE